MRLSFRQVSWGLEQLPRISLRQNALLIIMVLGLLVPCLLLLFFGEFERCPLKPSRVARIGADYDFGFTILDLRLVAYNTTVNHQSV